MLYLLLFAAGLGLAAYAWTQGITRTMVACFLLTGAMIGSADLLLQGILQVYDFRPGLLTGMEADSALGLVLADAWFVPILFTVWAPQQPVPSLIVGVVKLAIILGLEVLFVRAGQFLPMGWQLWHSVVAFSGYLVIGFFGQRLFRAEGYDHPAVRTVVLGAGATYAWHVWALVTDGMLDLWQIRPHLIADASADVVLGCFLFHGVPFIALGLAVVSRGWVRGMAGLAMTFGGLTLSLYTLRSIGLWEPGTLWNPAYEAAGLTFLLYVLGRLDGWFLQSRAETAGVL